MQPVPVPPAGPTLREDQPKPVQPAPQPTEQPAPSASAATPSTTAAAPSITADTPSTTAPSPTHAPDRPAPAGRLRRVGSISIKTAPVDTSVSLHQEPTAPPLDDEKLHECWRSMLEAMSGEFSKLAQVLKDKELRIDEEDMFTIIVSNSYTESEIKPHLIRMLTYLRAKSGRPNLNCKTEVVYEEKEAKAYTPRDKYDVMQHANPALETFRILFPEVDY